MKAVRILVWVLLFPLLSQGQHDLYVATNGNDITGDGSLGNPYLTIVEAAEAAEVYISTNPTTAVTVWVRGGTYRNADFSTTAMLSEDDYDPENAGEAIWKTNNTTGTAVRLNNIHGNTDAWITIRPYLGEQVVIEGDGDNTFLVRNCSYLIVQGFEIRGIGDSIPEVLGWKYWGTYRYLDNGNYVYGDRKSDICGVYGITPCTDIAPNVLTAHTTYSGLPNINSLNVERPNLFVGKGLLVQLSHHIKIVENEIHHFPGGGLRVTQSDYVWFESNQVHHNTYRASVGTHGLVAEGLTPESGNNARIEKLTITGNIVHSNYNEIYSWVQSKTIVTTSIDEGKGITLLRTSPSESGFNGVIRVENNIAYNNGKSGIHCNDVEKAEIINNTVYSNGYTNIYDASLSGGTNAGISIQSSDSITIINNIVVVTSGLSPALKALSEGQNCDAETVSNNLIFGDNNSDFVGGFTIADPLFTNMASNDVSLQASSPAINAALASVAPTTDFSGNVRDGNPDIGAYEHIFVVPVELLRFWLSPQPNGSLRLEWTTASERNHHHFEIERTNRSFSWEKIGQTTSSESGILLNKYQFLDMQPLFGENYYRLKQVDNDGQFEYSPIRFFENEQPAERVSCYPNPASGFLTLQNFKGKAFVFNNMGQKMIETTIENESQNINLSHLPVGSYLLYYQNEKGEKGVFRFVKM